MRVFLAVVAVSLAALAGCSADRPSGGMVTTPREGGLGLGSIAPDIPFTDEQGRPTSLNAIRQPITIIGFTEAPGEVCCRVDPELIRLASRYIGRPVTVVQVSLPTSQCPHGPGCVEACNVPELHLVTLCDPQRTAWNIYGRPEANTAYLIDDFGRLAVYVPLSSPQPLVAQADQLSASLKRSEQPSN